MRNSLVILITLQLLIAPLLWGQAPVGFHPGTVAETQQQLFTLFDSLCLNQQNSIHTTDRIILLEDGTNFDCQVEAERLMTFAADFKSKHSLEHTPPSSCLPDSSFSMGISSAEKILDVTGSCNQSGGDCLKDLTCNTITSVIPITMAIAEKFDCPTSKNGNCLTAVLRGVFDSIFTTVDAIWELGKWAGKTGLSWLKERFATHEEVTSDKLLMAGNLSDQEIEEIEQGPVNFVKKLISAIYQMSVTAIKEHYGCQQWSGAPMASRCLAPMEGWECASCTQKLNSVCGVVGFLGGEIVTSFLTGGLVGVAKVGLKSVATASGKVTSKMGKLLTPIKQLGAVRISSQAVAKGLQSVANGGRAVAAATGNQWQKIGELQLLNSIAKYSKEVGRSKSFALVSALPKGVGRGVVAYLKLMDRAFTAGVKRSERALTKKVAVQSSLPQVVKTPPQIDSKQLERFFLTASVKEQHNLKQIIRGIVTAPTPKVKQRWIEKLKQSLRCLK
jgi:hypothetical protein